MRRNLLLVGAIVVSVLLALNSAKRISNFHTNAQKVTEAQERLDKLKDENKKLKGEYAHKQSQEFQEAEIRNKLGLVKEGETVVILPKEESSQEPATSNPVKDEARLRGQQPDPNWQKWQDFLLGKL